MADEPGTATPTAEPKAEAKLEETKTFSQAELDRIVSDRLERERKKYEGFADLKAKAEQFDQLSEKDKTEAQKLADKLGKSEQAKADAEAKLVRYEVAAAKNVPAKLVPLLTAASKEELEAQADLILENAKPGQAPDFDGGAREPAPEPKTPEQAHNDLLLEILGRPRQT